jgi:CDP-glucose 4,6-dehydratase
LNGYLLVAENHLHDPETSPQSLNFGPKDELSVENVLSVFSESFPKMPEIKIIANTFGEHQSLLLDSSLARKKLGWQPKFTVSEAVKETADWYMHYLSGEDARNLSLNAIERFGFEKK